MSLNALGCAYSVGLMKPTVPRPALTLAEFTRFTEYAHTCAAVHVVSKRTGKVKSRGGELT